MSNILIDGTFGPNGEFKLATANDLKNVAYEASNGWLGGGVLSGTLGTTIFNVSAPTVRFADYTDESNPILSEPIILSAFNNISLASTAVDVIGVYIQKSGVTYSIYQDVGNSRNFPLLYQNYIFIGDIILVSGVIAGFVQDKYPIATRNNITFIEFMDFFAPLNLGANKVSASTTDLSINISSGELWVIGGNAVTSRTEPNTITFAGATAPSLIGVWFNTAGELQTETPSAQIDIANYNPNGTGAALVAITASYWVNIPILLNAGSGLLGYQYPTAEYATEAEALAQVGKFVRFTNPDQLKYFNILGYITVQQGVTDLSAATVSAGEAANYSFGGSSGSAGGGNVLSVFGRTGNVVATNGDYTSAQVTDNSTVGGPSVEDSLNTLAAGISNTDLTVKSVTYSVTGVEAIDQEDANLWTYQNVTTYDGQSITPAVSGRLTKIEFACDLATSCVVQVAILEGEGLSGKEVDESGVIELSSGTGYRAITFPNTPFLVTGNKYTFVITFGGGGPLLIGIDTSGTYAGGIMLSNPSFDFVFRTYMQPVPYQTMPSEIAVKDITDTVNNDILGISNVNKLITADGVYSFVTSQIATNAPIVSLLNYDNPVVNNTWYSLGYIPSDTSTSREIFEVNVQDTSSAVNISNIVFEVISQAGGYFNTDYYIKSGRISAIRPQFKIYQDPATSRRWIYIRIMANTRLRVSRYAYNQYDGSFIKIVQNNGTGTNPSGGTGTVIYDTPVNEAGYYAPKTVGLTANFWSGAKNCIVEFSVNSNLCTIYAHYVHVASQIAIDDVINFPAGTIPAKWYPISPSIPVACLRTLDANVERIGVAVINSSTDGSIYIMPGGDVQFHPVGSAEMGFSSWSTSWVIANS